MVVLLPPRQHSNVLECTVLDRGTPVLSPTPVARSSSWRGRADQTADIFDAPLVVVLVVEREAHLAERRSRLLLLPLLLQIRFPLDDFVVAVGGGGGHAPGPAAFAVKAVVVYVVVVVIMGRARQRRGRKQQHIRKTSAARIFKKNTHRALG